MSIRNQNSLLIAFIMATEEGRIELVTKFEQAIKSNADLMAALAKTPVYVGAHQFVTYDFEKGELKVVECINGHELGEPLTEKQKEILGYE